MNITSELIDETVAAMRDYQKQHFGTPNGPDFPAIAETLANSKTFQDACVTQGMMGLLTMLALPKKEEGAVSDKASGEKMIEDMKNSPVRDGLALMFYAGLKLGQRIAENHTLEQLAR